MRAALLLALLPLAACVEHSSAPGGLSRGMGQGGMGQGAARPGDYQASAEGGAYAGQVGAGAAGKMLTAKGAAAVQGLSVTVRAATVDGTLTGKDGLHAKAGARAICAAAGGAFNPAAIGRFQAPGAWVFEGACS